MSAAARPASRPAQSAAGVTCNVRDGIARIRLSRPRHGNRINQATARRLCDLAEEIDLDDSIALVVLSASGRDFCLGVEDPGAWEDRHDWVAAFASISRPSLAVVQGGAVAEGCELALACDLRLAAVDTRFQLPQIGENRLPRHGGTQRLPRLVGRMRALDLLLSGRAVGGREAVRIGLATRCVAPSRLAAEARAHVSLLRTKSPIALRLARDAVRQGMDLSLEQGIRLEQDLYVLLQTTADRREGIAAFLEKRSPRFEGR